MCWCQWWMTSWSLNLRRHMLTCYLNLAPCVTRTSQLQISYISLVAIKCSTAFSWGEREFLCFHQFTVFTEANAAPSFALTKKLGNSIMMTILREPTLCAHLAWLLMRMHKHAILTRCPIWAEHLVLSFSFLRHSLFHEATSMMTSFDVDPHTTYPSKLGKVWM